MQSQMRDISLICDAIECFHPSVSSSGEKGCCEVGWDRVAVCERAAGLRSGCFSDLNSACRRALVPVKMLLF